MLSWDQQPCPQTWALDALCRLLACPWLPFCVSCSELGRCPPEAFREFWGQAGVSQQSPGWSKFIMTAHLTRSVHGGSSHSPSPRTSWSSVPGTPSSLPRTPRGPLSPQQQALSQPSPPTRCDTVSGKGSPPGSESSPFAAVPRAGRGALSRDEVRDASTVRPCIHRGHGPLGQLRRTACGGPAPAHHTSGALRAGRWEREGWRRLPGRRQGLANQLGPLAGQ